MIDGVATGYLELATSDELRVVDCESVHVVTRPLGEGRPHYSIPGGNEVRRSGAGTRLACDYMFTIKVKCLRIALTCRSDRLMFRNMSTNEESINMSPPTWSPADPYDNLPLLPPSCELETKRTLKRCIASRAACRSYTSVATSSRTRTTTIAYCSP